MSAAQHTLPPSSSTATGTSNAERPTRKHHSRWRWLGTVLLLVSTAAVGTMLYGAYVYMPAETTQQSSYLAELGQQGVSHYVDLKDFRLHYVHVGTGAPVILIPGGGGSTYSFRELAAALAPNYSVYVLDPPGDGYTTPLATTPNYNQLYTLDAIDRTLLAFMDKLAIPKATFIGNSWGGGYALYFAEKHPSRVDKLVSLNGTGINLPDSWKWELTKWPVIGELAIKLFSSEDDVKSSLSRVLVHREVTDEMVRETWIPYRRHHNLISQWVLERNLDWNETERRLPNLRVPTLVVWGMQDTVLDTTIQLQRWRQLVPAARIVEVKGAGHVVHEDQPDRVAAVIEDFLGH